MTVCQQATAAQTTSISAKVRMGREDKRDEIRRDLSRQHERGWVDYNR